MMKKKTMTQLLLNKAQKTMIPRSLIQMIVKTVIPKVRYRRSWIKMKIDAWKGYSSKLKARLEPTNTSLPDASLSVRNAQ